MITASLSAMVASRRPRRAFTLVELMMSMGLFSVLAILIFSVMNMVTDITTRASTRLTTIRTARECLDLIGTDLRLSPPPYTVLGSSNSLQMDVNSTAIAASYRQPHTFFWQSPVSRTDKYGNVSIVGYYILRDLQVDPSKSRLQLRRLYVEPENPTSPPTSSEYLVYAAPADWHPDTLLKQFAPETAAADNAAGLKGWVADGVLAMWVRCLDPKGNPIVKKLDGTAVTYNYDSRASYQYTGVSATNIIYASPVGRPALPAYIEVTLVCVSPREISRIKTLPAATASNPALYNSEIAQFVAAARAQNPTVKTIESFTQKFRIYSARDL
ncbi:MAG: type II secretion system protein J [Candidatus Methylacidiphilales bacterium]|nr:prepilin-type N-terminal cleavage/methylation domain-containing protein [Candidatus Methylacidiphilales bacterium]